jgi:hypothetical protein
MDKRQSEIIILVCLLISAIIVFFALQPRLQPSGDSSVPVIPVAQASQPVVLTAVGAPDGKFSLNMKQEKGKDATAYTFLMSDGTSGIQKEIYSQMVPTGTTLSIPANTFSSDDKYIFLEETSPTATGYFVLTSSGASITKDIQTLDISGLFMAKYQNYVITDVTGWAGPTLVIVNTNKSDGSLGPSFWFDVSSRGFIELSDRFN